MRNPCASIINLVRFVGNTTKVAAMTSENGWRSIDINEPIGEDLGIVH